METTTGFFEHKFHPYNEEDNDCESDASNIFYSNFNHQSETTKASEEMLNFVEKFATSVRLLNLNQSDATIIFKLCSDLVERFKDFNLKLIEDDNGMNPAQALEATFHLVQSKISQFDSAYKRKENTESSRYFVAAEDMAIGTRFELKTITKLGRLMKIPRLIQTQFQYVSIVDTIRTLFQYDQFHDLYFPQSTNHICEPGKFKHYCCGSNFKNCELYQQHPESLQLQIGSDDFEICNPLSSKANPQVQRFNSKVNNIYLISLCNADDVKTEQTDFNNIWQIIKNEISFLETTGITTGTENRILKGTLTQVAFDNLGANTSLGFVGSFRSNYYCRQCECSNHECQSMCRENFGKLRSRESYDEQINIINNSVKVDYEKTKGVKYYCKLSDLKYFHVVDNPTADIMHDVCEGTIPFALKVLFKFCFKSKLFTLSELNSMIQFFDYGILYTKNKPSAVNLDKRSLGQNATQSLCLFRNIPFILYKYRTELAEIWLCIEPLLRVVEIVYSYEITETDLDNLNNNIYFHLDALKKFDSTINFIPKHHFLLHYAKIIRASGPLIHMNMIHYERKHKVFKDFANATHNFKNINKTLSTKHQQSMCAKGFTYVDDIQNGVISQLDDDFVLKYGAILEVSSVECIKVKTTKWLSINNYKYREHSLILHEHFLYGIRNILMDDDGRFFFLCQQFDVISFDPFLNSFKIEKKSSNALIEYSKLKNKKTYQVIFNGKDQYIIIETLELRKQITCEG